MDELDAGEEILRGEHYVSCPICDGTGYIGDKSEDVHCTRCRWSGQIVREAYVEAAAELGIKTPLVPETIWYSLTEESVKTIANEEDAHVFRILTEGLDDGST